jgi:hypothetical protein
VRLALSADGEARVVAAYPTICLVHAQQRRQFGGRFGPPSRFGCLRPSGPSLGSRLQEVADIVRPPRHPGETVILEYVQQAA